MWLYKNKKIESLEDMPCGTYGFIYEVNHIPSGRKYIGKKQLVFIRKKQLGKKAIEALTDKRAKKYEIIEKESDWKTYYGSHKDILKLIKEGKQEEFTREILQFVPDKKQLTYFECKYLFIKEVLEQPDSYINDNILGKFYRKDFYND